MTTWEKQSEEYKRDVLSVLNIERHVETEEYKKELKEQEKLAKKEGKVFHKEYIPSAKLISCNCAALKNKLLVLPDDIEVIGESAFEGTDITKVVLPKKLRFIEAKAFKNCKQLVKVDFNRNLNSIEEETFSGCEALEEAKFFYKLWYVGKKCFENCYNLKKVVFSETQKNIVEFFLEEKAFYNCIALEKIMLPQSIRKINKRTFYHCSSLKEINFPEYLGVIGRAAFWGCSSLKEVDLSNHYIIIDLQAFGLCGIEKFVFPKNTNIIRGLTLLGAKIEELYIPESVRMFDRDSLRMFNLEKIYIKEGKYADIVISQLQFAGVPSRCSIIKY